METVLENPREALRAKLSYRRGALKLLCEKSGFSRQYVYMVLRGDRQNDKLWLLAIEVLKEMAEAKESLNQEISKALLAAETL